MTPPRTNVHDLLAHAAEASPRSPALSYRNITVSYGEA